MGFSGRYVDKGDEEMNDDFVLDDKWYDQARELIKKANI